MQVRGVYKTLEMLPGLIRQHTTLYPRFIARRCTDLISTVIELPPL